MSRQLCPAGGHLGVNVPLAGSRWPRVTGVRGGSPGGRAGRWRCWRGQGSCSVRGRSTLPRERAFPGFLQGFPKSRARGVPAGRGWAEQGGTGGRSDHRAPSAHPIRPIPGEQRGCPPSPSVAQRHRSPSLPRPHPAILPALGFPSTEGGVEKNTSIIEPGRREPAASPFAHAAQVEARSRSQTPLTRLAAGLCQPPQGQVLRG